MKNLILLAYEFPPVNVGGSHRPLRFVKYLRRFNIEPIVITVHPEEYGSLNLDHALEKELPQNINVIRTNLTPVSRFSEALSAKYYFNIVDNIGKRLEKSLNIILPSLIQKFQPIGLLVTLPPFSLGQLSVRLSKKFNLPLYLDMRDAWSLWNVSPYASYLHFKLTLRAERECLLNAQKVIVTSSQTLMDLKKYHPGFDLEKACIIPNAYEKIEEPSLSKKDFSRCDHIVIGYVGSFYFNHYSDSLMKKRWWEKKPHQFFQYVPRKENWLYRSPYFFFKTLIELFAIEPSLRKVVKVKFAGVKPLWLDNMVSEFNLKENFEHLGFLRKDEVFEFEQKCDILLITSSKVENGEDYSIAGKTFEYVSLLKPILGLVSKGAQKDILEKTGLAVICDPDNIEESANKLHALCLGNIMIKPNIEFIRTLSAEKTVEKLANFILD